MRNTEDPQEPRPDRLRERVTDMLEVSAVGRVMGLAVTGRTEVRDPDATMEELVERGQHIRDRDRP